MTRSVSLASSLLLACATLGCGGAKDKTTQTGAEVAAKAPTEMAPDPDYAELDVGADWKSYTQLNKEPFFSKTHGKRFVDLYVNDIALEAYKAGTEPPVGSVIVKTSWETADGKPTEVAGPIFVMEKKPAGFSEETSDWWYGLHWAEVPPKWQTVMKASKVYWRTPSKKVGYCVDCHDVYDNQIGGIPEASRNY